ncbi:hypothetical protein ACQB60_36215 [Actinomycetota bacterium Odt1-20B]
MLALAATTFVGSATSASAGPGDPGDGWDHTWEAYGAKLYVKENGDVISVCDAARNGKPAWASLGDYSMTVTNGYGSCKTHRASEGGVYNLPESANITVWFGENRTTRYETVSFFNDH